MKHSRLARTVCGAALVAIAGAAINAPGHGQEPPAVADAATLAEEFSAANDEELDVVIVQATRSGRRVQDEPIRVEVIGREEIEEKLLMTPGSIAVLLAETGGVRLQVTSPALGATNVRMQGMRGRYTQMLADGLPLYGGQASSIGVLQVAPTDLGQVEIIKGAASALYGPSALGGVVNLVSRRPGLEPQAELLLNVTSRDGQDATAYASAPISGDWSYSVVGGAHRQTAHDLDDDGWLDIPGYERLSLRPRLFWQGMDGANAFFTLGVMNEDREGGTLPRAVLPDGLPFTMTQDTRRYDAGASGEIPLTAGGSLHLRGSVMRQDHVHGFGAVIEDDQHETSLVEASYAHNAVGASWLFGLAVQTDGFASETFPAFDYSFTSPGVFAQLEQDVGETLTLAGSVRWDDHSEYGSHLSPRLSLLYRPGAWRVRASVGEGFHAPTPFVEEIEAAGLGRLAPLTGLEAETARNASLDVGYTSGPVEITASLFGSSIDGAVTLEATGPQSVRLVNSPGETRTRGAELLARYRWNGLTVTGSYVHVDATEPDPAGGGRRTVPLTPHHTAGVVAMWEEHDKGRLGLEVYYTGEQGLDDNPFRTLSKPYWEVGLLGEIILGKVRLFVNAENILDVRQTRHDRLLRPNRTPDGQWTVDAWQPLDGFTVNAGVRIKFGGTD